MNQNNYQKKIKFKIKMKPLALLFFAIVASLSVSHATNLTPVSNVDLSKFAGVWWGYTTSGPNWAANTSMSCWKINFVPEAPKLTAEEHIVINKQAWTVNAYCNITNPSNSIFSCIEEGVSFNWNFFFVNTDYNRAMAYNDYFQSLNFYSRDPFISTNDLAQMIHIATKNGFPVQGHSVISDNRNCQNGEEEFEDWIFA